MNLTAASTLRMLAIALAGLIFFIPIYWVSSSAFRTEPDIFRFLSPISIWTWIPTEPTLQHIIGVWQSPFARAIFNSIFVAAVTVIGGLAVCALAAFALSVMEFRGRNAIFSLMVVSFLIPFDAIAVPLYYIMRGFQLQNTYAGLILPGIGNGLAVFLLRQFFLGIPRELREAALVDGMSWLGMFWRLYLPLSIPAMISAAIILFIAQWQAYLWPLLIAPANDYKVAAVAIAEFSTAYDVSFGLIFAGALFVSLIPMIVLVGFQQYFTASVASTGSKE
jgi:ABC-type glycerol-3-phosphate transport system permease component